MITLDSEAPPSGRLHIPGATIVEAPDHPVVARVYALPEVPPGDERPKTNFDYLSGSQVNAYRRCQASYLFKYFYKMREPDNTAMFFGSAVHAGAEAYLRTKKELKALGQEVSHDSLKAHAIEKTAEYVRAKITDTMIYKTQWKKGPAETFESLLESTQVATARLAEEVWVHIDALEVERGFVIEWKDPKTLPFLGFADIILKTPDGIEVRDLKTGAEKHTMDAHLDIALSSYAQSYEILSGQPARIVGYDNYVRNAKPKIVQVKSTRSDHDLERLYIVAKSITQSLAHGIYIPADDSMKCSGCHFYERCRTEYTVT